VSIEKVEAELIKDVPAIAGYEILSVAGSGGMSVVFKAKQTALGRIVAIKMLHKHLVTGALTLQRFMQEARLTTELKHANVADVFACGLTSDEQPFIAMEFLEGKSLRDLIHEKGALDPHEIRTLFEGILAGLTAAHQAGIVHRDLKPANVVLSKDQSGRTVPKIVDFGVAKIAAIPKGEYQRLTQTGAVVGSPAYMSPEQCTGVSIDARADIYSLGCMLFEALTGQVPFDSDNLFELMSKQLDATPPAPSTVASTEIPKAFDTITAKCLAKDPAQRYQNCYQLLKALSAVDMTQMAAVSHHQARRNTKPLKRNLWVVKITAVVLGVGLPAVIAWNWNSYSRRMNDVHALEAAVKAYDLAAASSMASRLANLKGLPDRAKVSVVESEYWLARALRDHGKKDQADDVLLLLDGQAEQCADAKYFALCMRLLDEKIAPHDRAPQLKAIERETSLLDSGYTKAPVYYWLAQNRGKEIAGDFYEKAVAAAMASNRTVHELHYRAIQGKAQAVWSEPEGYARNVRLLTDRKKNLVEDDTYESILALDRFASMAQAARDHELRWWCTDELYRKLQRNPNLPILAKGKILYLKGAQEQDKGRWSQSIPLFEQTIHTLERDFERLMCPISTTKLLHIFPGRCTTTIARPAFTCKRRSSCEVTS
jgi:serine/threonine protein kinase